VIAADLIYLRKPANSTVVDARREAKAYILHPSGDGALRPCRADSAQREVLHSAGPTGTGLNHPNQQGMRTVQDFPHRYHISASAETGGNVVLKADNLPQLVSAPPAQFGGPGDQWSPEHLLVASVADCFILTFRAVAHASKLAWNHLEASAEGVLERVDRVTRFTRVNLSATLAVPAGTDIEKARRLLQKAEESCLITNSLTAKTHLDVEIIAED
jgi:peroxiredoxin-like protein